MKSEVYKYPVMHRDKKYSISIKNNSDDIFKYEVFLYEKVKSFLWFKYDKALIYHEYVFDDSTYFHSDLVYKGQLYMKISDMIIDKYENTIINNEKLYCARISYKEWDGNLNTFQYK